MSTPWPMRRRLMLGFAIFALVVATLFGAYAVLFTYMVEDQFFSDALQSEAAVQRAHHGQTGRWQQPRSPYMRIHEEVSSLPSDLREQYQLAPTCSEFAGEQGRHYHILRLGPSSAIESGPILVAEVSQQLVVRRMRNDILQLLAWSALGVLALALLLGYWLAARTAAPLAALAQRVEAMQPNDPPQQFAQQFATHEVGVLAKGLESLAGRVHAFVVREREFTRDASHELRTPLAVFHSACERLMQDPSLSAEARLQVDFLRQSVWQLQQTVTTLLSLAREENSGQPSETVVLLPMIEQVVIEQSVLLEGKSVEVSVQVPARASMRLPPAALHILLGNLVGNAFAHTAIGRVQIDVHGGRLRIANSRGIDANLGSQLHLPFAKGEASAGYGLGLAIVQRLCDFHGVDLLIESDSERTTASIALEGADGAV